MLDFTIVSVPHPHYPEITYMALKWETSGSTSWINVDCPLLEVEDTLKRYMGTKEMDNLDFLVAIQMVREWKRTHKDVLWQEKRIRDIIKHEKKTVRYEA